MRVRYGKPIKVKSILGKSNFYSLSSASDKLISHNASSKTIQEFFDAIVPTHKLFLCYNVQGDVQSNLMRIIIVRHNGSSVMASGTVSRTDNYYYQKVTAGTGVTTNQPNADMWLQKNSGYTFASGTTFNCFVIDLTETFGAENEPTAQEFYNKYNKYFPLIATGEEITIDRGSGKISLREENKIFTNNLPADYQEVLYIESTGKQAINLNYRATQSTEFEITFMRTGTTSQPYYQWLLSAYGGGDYPQCTITSSNASFRDNQGNGATFNISTALNTKHTAIYHNKNFYYDGELQGVVPEQNNFTTDSMKLFDASRGSTLFWPFIARVYSCKIWSDSNTLARNMIPCYRKSDQEPGMYDLVNNVFYTDRYNNLEKFKVGKNIISCKVAGDSRNV